MNPLLRIDSRHGTSNNAQRDIINIIYPQNSGPPCQSQPFRQFNDAPTYLLSSHFTGRENELNWIERIFGVVHDGEPTRCVMYGMFGLGKTQLALKYATMSYQLKRYSLVFWISGATVEKLNQGLAKVLNLIDHPDRYHVEQSTKLTSARRWLEECSAMYPTKWLLVFDNVTQEALTFLQEHLPRTNSMGNILLTTRIKVVAEGVVSAAEQQHQFFELMAPNIHDAVKLLLKEAGINPNKRIASTSKDLVECLGRLPLAISQAASFAKQSHRNLDDVLGLYRSKHGYQVSFSTLLFCFLGYAYSWWAREVNELGKRSFQLRTEVCRSGLHHSVRRIRAPMSRFQQSLESPFISRSRTHTTQNDQ